MGRFQDFFEKNGIHSSQVGLALITFKFSTYVSWAGTLFLCYRYRPVKTLFTKWSGPRRFHEYIKTRYKTKYEKAANYVDTHAERLSKWKYFRPIPKFLGVDPQRFTFALAENVVLYKATLPITIPLQVWLTILLFRKTSSPVSLPELMHTTEFLEEPVEAPNTVDTAKE